MPAPSAPTPTAVIAQRGSRVRNSPATSRTTPTPTATLERATVIRYGAQRGPAGKPSNSAGAWVDRPGSTTVSTR